MRSQPLVLLTVVTLVLAAGGSWYAASSAGRGAKPTVPQVAEPPQTVPPQQESPMISVHVFNRQGELVGPIETAKLVLSDEEWRRRLTPEEYEISRGKGTERPFCGTLLDNKRSGVYACVGCGLPLFSSKSKFNSGTGWPSFFEPIADANVAELDDYSHGMSRIEILCARCDGHLGHVFDDGPPPTGKRYCLNGASLKFTPQESVRQLADPLADAETSDSK